MANRKSRPYPPRDSILVTGAAGFIGSHLVERLLEEGYHVWGLDNFDDSYAARTKRRNLSTALGHPHMHLVEGDVRDGVLLEGLLSDIPFDAVVHLAANVGTGPSSEDPRRCFETNVLGTIELLEAMHRHGAGCLLLASTSSVYGEDNPVPFEESMAADRPTTPYAASKRSAEMLAFTYHRRFGLSAHCLRLSPVYGPRQRPDLPIHRLARLMVDGHPVPPDGDSLSSDHVYVTDVVQGMLGSLERVTELAVEGPVFEILNLGGASPVPEEELIAKLEEVLGVEADLGARPETTTNGGGDAYASHERARESIGFRPRVGLDDGLARFAEWFWSQPEVAGAPAAAARMAGGQGAAAEG